MKFHNTNILYPLFLFILSSDLSIGSIMQSFQKESFLLKTSDLLVHLLRNQGTKESSIQAEYPFLRCEAMVDGDLFWFLDNVAKVTDSSGKQRPLLYAA